MKPNKLVVFLVSTLLALMAFSGIAYVIEWSGVFTPPLSAPPLLSEVDQNEQAWQALGIANYRIEVQKIDSIWHAQTYIITVQDNQVVTHSSNCFPAPFEGRECEARSYDTADYVVEGLFASARDMASGRSEYTEITFDPTYHFPLRISYNHPEILDEDSHWRVVSFEVLPALSAATDSQSMMQRWTALGITHYRLTVSITIGGMIDGAHSYTVEVNGTEITPVSFNCLDDNGCDTLELDLYDYSIVGLFDIAQQAETTEVVYDSVYHFPIEIYGGRPSPCSGCSRDAWYVSDFEVLP